MTESECLAIGGHCWKEHHVWIKGMVTPQGTGSLVPIETLIETRERTCKHCGRMERLTDGDWKEVEP